MALNLISPTTYTTAILIGDTTNGASMGNLPTLTTFMGQPVSAALELQSPDGALLLPRLTNQQIVDLNSVDGMLVYNSENEELDLRVTGIWEKVAAGPDVMSFHWNVVGISLQMIECNGYIVNAAGPIVLTMPFLMNVGDYVRVTRVGAGDWTIAQNAGQQIIFGNQTTTLGVGGSLSSTDLGDTVEILCWQTNTGFIVISSVGNINVV